MVYSIVRHKVKDYAAWKRVFDGFIDVRRAGGEKSWQILHPADDTNNLWLIFEWDNAQNARAFFGDNPELAEAMKKAGVLEHPEVHIVEEYDRGNV